MIIVKNKNNEAQFSLISNKLFKESLNSNIKEISLYDEKFDDSYEIKAFIADIFYKKYKAQIKVSYPELMTLIGKNNEILAALGIRDAKQHGLFLEQYLDDNIENILSKIYKNKVNRDEIVEIGSLASQKKGMAKFLYIALSAILKQRKYKYAIITGTLYLQKYFKKAGLKPRIIGPALREKLKDQTIDWGSYYETEPKIMVLDVESGYFILRLFLGISVTGAITKLYPFIKYE